MARQPNKPRLTWEQVRDSMWADRDAPVILSPAAYEEVRRELGWQPARRFDAAGAHYEVD